MNLPLDFINIVEPNGRMSYFSIHGNSEKNNRNKMMSVGGGLEHSTIHAKPVDVLKNKINPTQILNKVVELDIGDNVRTMIKKDKFDKKSSIC